ncbi:hypothetical protein ACFXPQ_33145 [Streptomyces lydicus]|uniref:hypothetical protein n=1 Tax=Streptomyces lydicus TaxID=47763 RepID=UPI0036CF353C
MPVPPLNVPELRAAIGTATTGGRYGCSPALFATRGQQRRVILSFSPTRGDATQVQATQRIAGALARP